MIYLSIYLHVNFRTECVTLKNSLCIFYGTLLSVIVLLDTSKNNLMNNNYSIIIMFIMTLEFELFMYLSIWNAKRDTAKLLKDSK